MTTQASVRLLRASLAGSLIFILGAGGHLGGGGEVPRPGVMAALFVVTIVPIVMLSSYRFSVPGLLCSLGAGQGWLHWSLDALGPGQHPTSALLLPASMHAGHLPSAGTDTSVGIVISSPDAADGWPMFAAHAAATLATALCLGPRRGCVAPCGHLV